MALPIVKPKNTKPNKSYVSGYIFFKGTAKSYHSTKHEKVLKSTMRQLANQIFRFFFLSNKT